jgi:hypothetical protein
MNIIIALLLGAVAGAIDTVPMIGGKAPRHSIVAIFVQWVVIGLLIPFVHWGLAPWLTGMIIGLLGMAPFMILTHLRNPKAVPTIALAGLVLGAGVGFAGGLLIH